MCKDCNCSITKVWAYLKVLSLAAVLIVIAVLAVGGYFYFKGDLSEDAPDLDDFKQEFRTKMKKV
jgi:hypothetical protein